MNYVNAENRKILVENLELLAAQIKSGIVVESAGIDWKVIDDGLEWYDFGMGEPETFQSRPKIVGIQLDLKLMPHVKEWRDEQPKKKKRKGKK